MVHGHDLFPLALAAIGLGTLLGFQRALEPFYGAGYFLRFDLLMVVLLPYVIYGIGAWLRRDHRVVGLGMLLAAADLWIGAVAPFGELRGAGRLFSQPWPWVATAILVLLFWLFPTPSSPDESDHAVPEAGHRGDGKAPPAGGPRPAAGAPSAAVPSPPPSGRGFQ